MAYNPFNIFRRNQKALFAVLTVFVMVVFTLSSGVAGGDFFETVSRWLGSRSGSGEPVAKIDGDTITVGDLESGPRSVQFKRVMANRFMSLAADQVTGTLRNSLLEQQSRLGPEGRQTVGMALDVMDALNTREGPLVVQQLPLLAANMTQRIESPTARSEDKEAARSVQVLFELLHKLGTGGGSHYFTNAPNRNRRDLIEFLLWEKKAEQLGIKFTQDDVWKLVQNEFYGYFRGASEVEVRKTMQHQSQGFTMEACLEALAAEFRVRAAQSAVLGHLMSRYNRAPAYPTPYETFDYYREQCSPAEYQLVPVPAAAFIDQVPGTPSDLDINDLFRKYAEVEPDPRRETPGFKEPRKIAVGWLGITGEEPYYLKLADEQIKVGEAMAKASGMLAVPLPGAVGTWAAGAVAPLSVKDPAVDAAYTTHVNQFKFQLRNEYSSPSLFVRDLLPSSIVRPGVLAATAGGFVGQAAGFGHPAMAVSVAMGAPIGYEIRDRVKVGVPLVLGGIPGPALFQTAVMGTAAATASEPKPLPIDYLRPELLKNAVEARAKIIAFGSRTERGDIAKFTEELAKFTEDGRIKDKAGAEKYIQEFIATRGLKHSGKSTEPRTEWDLEDDPGLLPLVVAQKESLRQAGPFHGNEYMPFGQSFFWMRTFDQATFRPRRGPATSGLYQAQTYPPGDPTSRDDGKPHFVVWRTEDVAPAKRNPTTARADVIAAWKRMKARELAQTYANNLANTIRAYPEASEFAIREFVFDKAAEVKEQAQENPKLQQWIQPFVLDKVCPLVPSTNPLLAMQGRSGLEAYELKESERLPYPTPEMRTALLENRDKPAKTVLVLPDAPKDTFYVATLLGRKLKTTDDFRFDVYSRFGNAREIISRHYLEASNRARESVIDLLKKEFKYEETEEQKQKLDDNVKSGGRDAE